MRFLSWRVMRGVGLAALAGCTLGAAAQAWRAQTVAEGLEHPWAVAFLPQGRFLVTERPGRMRIVQAQGRIGPPLGGLPRVAAGGQGGLLDVVLDRDFERNRQLFFCFSEPGPGGNSTALARAKLAADESRLEEVQVIFSQRPKVASGLHFGCRIVESTDGLLFLALGERFQRMQDAQTLDNHHGKLVRVTKDGAPPPATRSWGAPGRCRRSGATGTATHRARRSRRTAGCGSTSTDRRAATRSTCRRPAATAAGR